MNPPSHIRRTRTRSSWAWQALLVFGPLLVLAGIGVWGIRESRMAAKRHAIQAIEATVPVVEQFARDEKVRMLEATEKFYVFARTWPEPATAGKGAELYGQVMSLKPDEAEKMLVQLETEHANETTEGGLPLLPLVKWARLQCAVGNPERDAAAEALAVAAVRTHPSAVSMELLSRAADLLRERGGNVKAFAKWLAVRAEHEQALEIWNAEEHRHPGKKDEWVPYAAPEWYFDVVGSGYMRALSPERQREGAGRMAARAQAVLPEYFAVDVASEPGRSLLSSPPRGERFFERTDGVFKFAWVLTDPAKLYAEQMRQSQWLGAILVAALLAATAGFFVLRRSLSRERQLSEMKSNFVSSVSHELRAPLASMRLMAENLEIGVVTEEPRRVEYHRLMADECRRLTALVDNVLDFARIEQGRKVYHFGETDLSALIADSLRLLAPVAERRGQKFVTVLDAIAPRCDGLAIQQALVNLLDNAIKFAPVNSTITVRVSARSEGRWALSVSDEGPGVPPAEREKIFERFYRIGSELTRETPGAGIGLSIVKHIAEGHGGKVEVDGATFTLVLPLQPGGKE